MARKINASADELVIDVMPAPFLTDQPVGQMLLTAVPTPENTPVPGGGRWAWDYSLVCWVDLDAPAAPDTNLIQPE
ncbi:MAG: hypothetical protein ABI606_06300 [Rhodoferax sp.]